MTTIPTPPPPTFDDLVASYRERVDRLTLAQVAGALGSYAFNLAVSGSRPAEFELAHLIALAERVGVAVDVPNARARWLISRRPGSEAAAAKPAPRGLWARLKALPAWRWS